MKQQLTGLHERDNWHAVLGLGTVYGLIAVAIFLPYAVRLVFGTGWWAAYPVSVLAIGLFGAKALGHPPPRERGARDVLCRNRHWNFIAGTFCSGFLICQSWHAYRVSHVLGHHVNLGDPKQDPDYAYLLRIGVGDHSCGRCSPGRYLVAPLFLVRWNLSKIADRSP